MRAERCGRKQKPGARFSRIDPVDAVIDAHALMLLNNGGEPVDLDNELQSYLDMMGWA
jgi:phage terminase large subunit-like protein